MDKINIAIDGYSSCGKSTLAKEIASILRYVYIDSGAMYRAVTLYCIQHKLVKDGILNELELVHALPVMQIFFRYNDKTGKSDTHLNGKNVDGEIRTMEVSNMVSQVSSIPEVRTKLVSIQQKLGEQKGVVMDGRDIGTVVFPDAELKLFMTADPKVRAERRKKELVEKNIPASYNEVLNNIQMRDHEDTNRIVSPLTQAEDAVVLDNTNLTRDEQLAFVVRLVNERLT